MIQLKCKGKRIRASDRYLVYRFCAGTLLSLFVAVLLLLNMGQLMRTDWKHFSLLDNGLTLSIPSFLSRFPCLPPYESLLASTDFHRLTSLLFFEK